jgi:hypothetical protein
MPTDSRRNRARRSRDRLTAPELLEAILDRAGESRFARVRPPIAARLWKDAVGARIADRARPISLFGGVLVLLVPSSVWAHELSLLTDEICASLRGRGVNARELRFRVGAVPAVERPPERRVARAVPVAREVPRDLAPFLAKVGDGELRAAIGRAAASNLAWQSVVRSPPEQPVSEAQRAARAPRFAGEGSAPPDPALPASPEGPPDTRATGPNRPR